MSLKGLDMKGLVLRAVLLGDKTLGEVMSGPWVTWALP